MKADSKRAALVTGEALALLFALAACGGGGGAGSAADAAGSGAPAPGAEAPAAAPSVVVIGGGSPSPAPAAGAPSSAPSPSSPATITIAGLGSPRILISDAATLNRLRTSMSTNAASAVRFKAIVDSQISGGNVYAFEPWNAALLSRVTSTTSYCSYAVAQTDSAVQAEESLIGSSQRAGVAGDSYLEVGSVVGGLSMVYDWCRPQMTAAQRTRWINYANQAVWNVWNYNQAKWGNTVYPWTGWSIDNPSNNYYYSFLRATMLLGLATYGENPAAPGWIQKFRVEKIANQLVPSFTADLPGGGSREGTGYGVAMRGLFDLYYLWEKSTGERIADLTPHTLASFDKFMHDIVPTLDRVAPTGDHSRDSSAVLFDYHREYLEILSRLYPSDAMAGVSKTLLAQSFVPQMASGFERWVDYVYDQSDIAAQPLSRLATAHWSSGTGQFSTRSAWSTDATYANFICGPYTESHAHRDQSSFVLYKGAWLGFDENILSRSGLRIEEAAHNLVRIEQGGSVVTQTVGSTCNMRALVDTPTYSYASANATPSYTGKAAVQKVEREFLFIKPGAVVILDRIDTAAGASRIWTLNLPVTPSVSGDTLAAVNSGHRLDVTRLAPVGLASTVVSWPAADSDSTAGSRVDVVDLAGASSVFLTVLSTDGAVSSAVRSDATGLTGAQLTLSDGRVVTARFSTAGAGGTLEFRAAGGAVMSTGALPTSVASPPRLAN